MVNYNGDLLPDSNHFLNHQNRAFRFGDAVSEHIRHSGKTLLFWEDHYFRLMAAMRQLRMEIPMDFTLESLQAQIEKTLQASGLQERPSMVGVHVFRLGGANYLPETREVSFVIEVSLLEQRDFLAGKGPFVADLFRDYYLQADGLARLPHHNRIPEVLASIYAHENDLDTCLLLNHKKEMAQGLHGNLFLRKGTLLRTPPLESGCGAGILRARLLLQDWSEAPFELKEEAISPFDLQQADELFLLSTVHGVQPVTHYRKATYSTEAAAYIAGMLNQMAAEAD